MVPLFILLFLSIKKRYFNYIMLLMCYFAMVLFSGTRIQLISLGITLLYIAIRKGLIKTQGFIKIFRMIICIFIFGVGLNLLSYVRSGGNLLNILSYFDILMKIMCFIVCSLKLDILDLLIWWL